MNRRKEEIKERIAKRKKERAQQSHGAPLNEVKRSTYLDDDHVIYPPSYTNQNKDREFHPLFRPEMFMMKLLVAACLVLIVAIIHKNDQAPFQQARETVQQMMETEFQFAAVSKWYEEQFGSPIALLEPMTSDSQKENDPQFAVPASGKVLESFEDNGQGITVETTKKQVEAMNEGVVVEVSEKEATGLTVIIQHSDGTETWYGHLGEVDVALYDYVKMGESIGQVKLNESEQGTYYFAIKKGDQFIDPNQVISFE
ncbi:M23 family metallopeptidase [Bacillus kexueae]|uniref:M23 family metallopeptidase n=1 Tax=Aeribacillus kexueae TaxID=2078952 RepID=UPI001FAF5879|nr:M23 family metallopeptidase [Bacillus kexueae]